MTTGLKTPTSYYIKIVTTFPPRPITDYMNWLNALGLKLTVAVCTDTEDNNLNAEVPSQLSV